MVDRRIYAGDYRRYDGKVIYVVTMAKDADTDEGVVIWTPNVYSDKCASQVQTADPDADNSVSGREF